MVPTRRKMSFVNVSQMKLTRVASATATVSLVAAGSLSVLSIGSAAGAHAARVQSVTDSARLQLVSADGNTLVEKGRASGTLPGTVEVSLTLGDRTATSSFTIRSAGGTISGHGAGTLTPGKGGYDSFGGAVTVVRGTGRFRGASGKGGLYGSIYRATDAMSVQVTGKLRY
jgi:hypothetical protein